MTASSPEKPWRRFSLFRMASLLLCLIADAPFAEEIEYSGYLGDHYGKLEEVELNDGDVVRRWTSEEVKRGQYHSVLVNPVIYFPRATPSAQVSQQTLEEIAEFVTVVLKEAIAAKAPLVDRAGPDVLRVSAALTSVITESEDMSAVEFIPLALVFSSVQRAVGERDQQIKVFLEVRVSDSLTGELRGAALRVIKGRENLPDTEQQLELERLRADLRSIGDDAADALTLAR